MTKDELTWIIIRTIGFIFIVLIIVTLPKLSSSIYYFSFLLESMNAEVVDDAENTVRLIQANMINQTIQTFVRIIVLSISAWYFLARGKLAFKLISREASA